MIFRRSVWRILAVAILLSASYGSMPVRAARISPAEAMLETMTPEEKVGQLFLATFEGTEVEDGSQIHQLISRHHLGGLVLLAKNNNFTSVNTLTEAQSLIAALQQLEWDSTEVPASQGDSPAYVPLLIGIPQIGNGAPDDQILEGVTKAPSQMALGATWDLSLASKVGEMLGRELNALGFNLYLGPNMDVLETPNGQAANYLGVRAFGGDPFWVGEMGKAFVNGLHTGSANRMMVVAQNFPGTGNSDRSPDEEVATVRKSLEQLKQIELPPFFSITEPAIGDPSRVDAVMLSHIRYQGFQGNIRATTKPISFDANALQQIMALPTLETWREVGGIIISDNLGSGAVRRFFDPTNEIFPAKQIALNAFLAGNDMLYVDNYTASGDSSAYTTLVSIMDLFIQKYEEDAVFAQRVDTSVTRILNAKQALYGEFSLKNVLASQTDLSNLGKSQLVTFDAAQQAVTLISPSAQELDALLPSPPLWHEDVIVFTDVRPAFQCVGCPPINVLNTDSFVNSLTSLYGPQVGGQILQQNLSSFTLAQLTDTLEGVENGASEYLLPTLRAADWVVFLVRDSSPALPSSSVLQRILENRLDLLSGKRVIVFALDSPVYLDATNISKITAYYALYSKVPAFIDVAARVLMQEISPSGALPISLNAVGYDLISMTAPDPNQIIKLELVMPQVVPSEVELQETPQATQTPEPTPMPKFNIGDTITIRTGIIQDHNGNRVPDGTVVRFNFRISGEPGITQQFETMTTGGIAYFNYRIEAAGGLEVSATSEPATQSETLNINIEPDGSAAVFAISPTPLISPTPTEAPTVTITPEISATEMADSVHGGYPTLGEWALGIILMGLGGVLAFIGGQVWWGSSRWGLRSLLCTVIGGLISYTYLNLGLSGTQYWMNESGTAFVAEVVVVGLLMGWVGALIWWMRTEGRYPHRKRQ